MKQKLNAFVQARPETWKMIKFTFMGLFGGVTEMGSYYLMVFVLFANTLPAPFAWWIFKYDKATDFWAMWISAAMGYAVGFILNRKHTFHADSNPALSIFLYVIMVVITVIGSAWLGGILTSWFNARDMAELGGIAAKPLAALVAAIWTYPVNRFVIHRKKKEPA